MSHMKWELRSRSECLLKSFWSTYDQSKKLVATVDGRYVGFMYHCRIFPFDTVHSADPGKKVVVVELMSRNGAIALALSSLDIPEHDVLDLQKLSVWERLRPIISAFTSFAKNDMGADSVIFQYLPEDSVDRFVSQVTFFRQYHYDTPLGIDWEEGFHVLRRTVNKWQLDVASE